jgi:hypothetical protein
VILSGRWYEPYFARGLVIYRNVVSLGSTRLGLSADQLRQQLRGGLGPSLDFHELSPNTIAFREALFELKLFSYTPVMHGLLRYDQQAHAVTVEGRANWFTVAFSVLVLAFVWHRPEAWPVVGFLAVVLGGIYAVQAGRFRTVARCVTGAAPTLALEPPGRKWRSLVSGFLLALFLIGAVFYWFAE